MAVEVTVKGHDLELTPRLEEYVAKKVGKLDHYLDTITEATVELSFEKNARSADHRQVAQLTVRGRRGLLLRTEERTDDMFAALDAAVDKIHRQIERYKGRHRRGRGNGASAASLAEMPAPAEDEPGVQSQIVRRKRFQLRPMDETEALEQMHLLGHDNFFVFFNAQNNSVNVLYRRNDGTYGLIAPEMG